MGVGLFEEEESEESGREEGECGQHVGEEKGVVVPYAAWREEVGYFEGWFSQVPS